VPSLPSFNMPMESSTLLSTEAYHNNRRSCSYLDTTSFLGFIAISLAGCALITVMANSTGSRSDLWASTTTRPTLPTSVSHDLHRFSQHRLVKMQSRVHGTPGVEVADSTPLIFESSSETSSTGFSIEGQKQMVMAFGGIVLGTVFAIWKWASTNVTTPVRGAVLSSVVAGAALTMPNVAAAEMPMSDAGVAIEDSPMMQAMLQKSLEQRDARQKELLDKYYKKNFYDYFEFGGGCRAAPNEADSDIVKATKQWCKDNQ